MGLRGELLARGIPELEPNDEDVGKKNGKAAAQWHTDTINIWLFPGVYVERKSQGHWRRCEIMKSVIAL